MYGREPIFANEVDEVMLAPVDWNAAYDDVPQDVVFASLMERAALLRRYAPIALGNLLIAQHRQSLYYAQRRDGRWAVEAPAWFTPGQFVTTTKLSGSTNLDPPAFLCLRVLYVRSDGTLILQGLDGAWISDNGDHWAPVHDITLESVYVDRSLASARNSVPGADRFFACPVCSSSDSAENDVWFRDSTRTYDTVMCDWCENMHHCSCVGLPVVERDRLDTWYCPTCVRFAAPPQVVGRTTASS